MNQTKQLKSKQWIEKRIRRYQKKKPKTDVQARKWLIAFPQFDEELSKKWAREAIIIQYDLFIGEQYKMSISEAYQEAIAEFGRRWQQWRQDTQEYIDNEGRDSDEGDFEYQGSDEEVT